MSGPCCGIFNMAITFDDCGIERGTFIGPLDAVWFDAAANDNNDDDDTRKQIKPKITNNTIA
eukprot:1200450-Ditylum_brightwellii.AAC.1